MLTVKGQIVDLISGRNARIYIMELMQQSDWAKSIHDVWCSSNHYGF